jgi:hypothetical protein
MAVKQRKSATSGAPRKHSKCKDKTEAGSAVPGVWHSIHADFKKRRLEAALVKEAEEEETRRAPGWASVSRTERYKRRCLASGCEAPAGSHNPLPGRIDPITLEEVEIPGMAPSGHVMGMAIWRTVIAERGRNPFTNEALQMHQIVQLTHENIDRYRDKLVE